MYEHVNCIFPIALSTQMQRYVSSFTFCKKNEEIEHIPSVQNRIIRFEAFCKISSIRSVHSIRIKITNERRRMRHGKR